MLKLPYYPGLYTAPRHHLPPEHDTLETDGPLGTPNVNRVIGTYLGVLEYQEFLALPEHAKNPREKAVWEIDHDTARRAIALLDTLKTECPKAAAAIKEIRWRFLLLHPHCDYATSDPSSI